LRAWHCQPTRRELPGLLEPDVAEQVPKTRIIAQGVKVGMYLEELQNV